MNPEILKAAKKIGEERGIPVEVKPKGNSYYLYRDTTRWDKERKKRVKVSEYIGRITEYGLVERNRRTIYEFGNSELLLSAASDLIPELKHRFPDHWSEILAMSMIRAEEETNMIRKIESGEMKQKDLIIERNKLGKFAILSNLRSDPKEIYELYKSREEVEVAFDSMKNELENDKSYLHTTDGIRGYFFISFVSLYIYFSILETLKEKKLSQKISVKDALFELSKIYVIADGARRSVAEIPDRSQKIADAFGLKLYPKIVRS
ncbi:MAG: hypothetical protein LVQ96_00930 [Thermoplasmatales archaeon]|nr:hypothetical protein [Thermoplasmatales archaeon]MCW6169720.1 hypothetical protein [Thermoplasmatales archaeon]